MRNYVTFQVKIELSKVISTFKDFIFLVSNLSNSSMKNDMFNFFVLKFFDINTYRKVLHPLPIRWEFPSLSWVKINIDGVVRNSTDLTACDGIFLWKYGC